MERTIELARFDFSEAVMFLINLIKGSTLLCMMTIFSSIRGKTKFMTQIFFIHSKRLRYEVWFLFSLFIVVGSL